MKIYPVQVENENMPIELEEHSQTSRYARTKCRGIGWQPILTGLYIILNDVLCGFLLQQMMGNWGICCIIVLGLVPIFLMILCIHFNLRLPSQGIGMWGKTYLLTAGSHLEQAEQCTKCGIFRNTWTRHCRRCDACHLGYDHFCPWINSCIHSANLCIFLWFLITLFLTFILIFVVDIAFFCSTLKTLLPLACVSCGFSVLSLIFLIYTSSFQFSGVAEGVTTKQFSMGKRGGYFSFQRYFCHRGNGYQKVRVAQSLLDQDIPESVTELESSFQGSPTKKNKSSALV